MYATLSKTEVIQLCFVDVDGSFMHKQKKL